MKRLSTYCWIVGLICLPHTGCWANELEASRCLPILRSETPVSINTSLEDDTRRFASFNDFEWGEYKNDGPAFVGKGGVTLPLDKYLFKMPDGTKRLLKAESFSIRRSLIYVKKVSKKEIVCIVSPFSGLGSSGSFQAYAVVLTFDSSAPLLSVDGFAGAVLKINGDVGLHRKSQGADSRSKRDGQLVH